MSEFFAIITGIFKIIFTLFAGVFIVTAGILFGASHLKKKRVKREREKQQGACNCHTYTI